MVITRKHQWPANMWNFVLSIHLPVICATVFNNQWHIEKSVSQALLNSGCLLNQTTRSKVHCSALASQVDDCILLCYDKKARLCQCTGDTVGTVSFRTAVDGVCYAKVVPTSPTTAPPPPPPPPLACPTDWMEYRSSCYMFSVVRRTFTEAVADCQMVGANIIKLDNIDEGQFIKSQLHGMIFESWWVGLSDVDIPGRQVWERDGSILQISDYSDFGLGQGSTMTGTCQEMNPADDYKWYDTSCYNNVLFICEIS